MLVDTLDMQIVDEVLYYRGLGLGSVIASVGDVTAAGWTRVRIRVLIRDETIPAEEVSALQVGWAVKYILADGTGGVRIEIMRSVRPPCRCQMSAATTWLTTANSDRAG